MKRKGITEIDEIKLLGGECNKWQLLKNKSR
jgi:hypothetical protein